MQIKIAFLKSKVAKRIFFLFIASSIIPIMLVGILAYNYVTSNLIDQKQDHLTAASKSYGMAIYDRLLASEQQLNLLIEDFSEQSYQSYIEEPLDLYSDYHLFSDFKFSDFKFSDFKFSDFNSSELKHLQDGEILLTTKKDENDLLNIYLNKVSSITENPILISVKLDSESLFNDADYFSGIEEACVVINKLGTLNCSSNNFASISNTVFINKEQNNNDIQQVNIEDTEYVVSNWELFLKGRFNANSWIIHYAEPSEIIFAPIQSFIRILLPSLLISILLISLVSLSQISKILIPLEKLLSITKKVAKSDFGLKADFTSNDEFQELGESFNLMTDELEKREKILIEQAHYDDLTGLPSRTLLIEKIDKLIAAENSTEQFAYLFVDLDRFKVINDSHGHHVGDKLLRAAAERITNCVSNSDIVARYGGDEFGVIIIGDNCVSSARNIANNIIMQLSKAFYIDNYEQYIGASVGVSIYPQDGETSEAIIQKSDIAMYSAKQKGRGKSVFFSDTMQKNIREKLRLETDLFHAIEKEEIYLVYQPQLDLSTDTISGVEVLMRWNHSELGIIRPDRFIDYAEGNGFIVQLGKWAIREALSQCEKWQIEHQAIPKIAINVSPKQLQQEDFINDVEELISDIEIGITNIEFEITESLFLNDEKRIFNILKRLNNLGIGVAIDDFGKGYSSMSYLKKFPTQSLKIDRLFIKDIATDSDSRAIVQAIISMGKALDKVVIAEGIENVEQLNILKELGCHRAQGFYISKPKLADEVMGHTKSRIIKIEQFKDNYNIG